jgi:hemoglobin-like flavoprotein
MSQTPAFAKAAAIEASLEAVAELGIDPTAEVYARLFERHPQMKPQFWRDTNDAIKGEMLSRTFAAILDFVGARHYADHMIGTEMVTHEGYDVPREVFATFFEVVRDALRALLADGWTPEFETAWTEMLAEIDSFAGLTPRTDVTSAYYAPLVEAFQQGAG